MNTTDSILARAAGHAAPPARQLRPGAGTLLTVNKSGIAISVPRRAGSFPHPFKPGLGGRDIFFARGLVDVYEPKIAKVPISGAAGEAPPRLALDPETANENGESWCCVEVEPDAETGVLTKESRVEMIHASQPTSAKPEVGRHPVCLVLWRNQRPVAVHEITFFNLQYRRIAQASGPALHFFF